MKKPKTPQPVCVSTYNNCGEEILDPRPMNIPLGFKRPPTLAEVVQRLVRSEQVRQQAVEAGHETFEEANDFDLGEVDEYLPDSPYEVRLLDGETAPTPPAGATPFKEETLVKPELNTPVEPVKK